MQIASVSIRNYRSIRALDLDFCEVTALLGSNNAGKSSVLRALQIFFEAAPKLTDDDYYHRRAEEIQISVIFKNLVPSEIAEFGGAVSNGLLSVTRTFRQDRADAHLHYSVNAPAYPAFAAVRAEQSKTTKRSLFNRIADETEGLDRASNAEEVEALMLAWEAANPGLLQLASIRGFFGAPNVASGKLAKKTSVHYVPAVADAGEETSGAKKSPIINLLSEIARQVYENQREVVDFISRSQTEFSELVSPERFPQLASISDRLTSTVQRYYRDSRLMADWASKEGLKVSFPQPSLRIEDNGFVSGLENVGHGLQRAALFSVIEFLASKVDNDGEGFDEAQSDIVLLVEEPEIYQHPSKQQVIHDAFHQICKDFSTDSGIRFQIVFSTHSEKFIGMNKFQSARILRRTSVEGEEQHGCSSVSVSRASQFFAEALGRDPLSDASFESKMYIFSREICEGFFAQKVVLVEGVSDRAVLEAAYRAVGRQPEAEGIAIISVDGKTKMDKPLFVFNSLGIPAFAVFDSDRSKSNKKQKVNANVMIQRVLGIAQPVDFPDGCFERFASFSDNMEAHLKGLNCEVWEREVQAYKDEYGFDSDDICKTPWVAQQICEKLVEGGAELDRFKRIIESVDAL